MVATLPRMLHDQTPYPPAPPTPSPTPPSRRRPLALIALAAVALGVAGGGAAAVALRGDGGSDRLAVATAAGDETTTTEGASGSEDPASGSDDPAAGSEGERPGPGEGRGWGEHRRPGAHGTVTGVDGTTVTVEDLEGEATTITTDDETTVLDVAEGELADLAAGDNVVVMAGPGDDEGATGTARRIVDLGALDPATLHPDRSEAPEGADDEDGEGRHRFGPTVGTVAAVDGTSVTVTTEDGDVTVTTDDETAVAVVTEIAVADLAEGDTVGARGEVADDGTVAADVIIRGDLPAGGPGFGPGGPGRGGPGGMGACADPDAEAPAEG